MINRLTKIWPGLLRRGCASKDEEGHEDGSEREPLLVDEDQMEELEQSMLKTFKNQYWTRLIRVEDFCAGQQDKFELGPDVAEAVDEMYRLDADAMPEWKPLFDPQAFQQEHPKPLLKEWVLAARDIDAKREQVAKLRAQIDEKAEQYLQDDEMPPR